MPPIDILLAFFAATAVFAYIPGPSTLYAAARTLAGGRRSGWLAALGIHLGGYVHVFAAAFGLALLFKAVPKLYLGLKFAGAAYLIWLGVAMFQSRPAGTAVDRLPQGKPANRAFWDSATVEVLNPKTALFYLAFLPQFTDPSAVLPVWGQLLILGTMVNLMFSSADVICVLVAARILEALKGPGAMGRWVQRICGTILIGLGIKLAASHN